MSFATADDLSTYLTGTVSDDAAWISQAELFLEMIAEDIKSAAGQDIAAGTQTALLAGTWSRDLILPQRPVTEVTTVRLNGLTLAPGEYVHNERGLLRRGADSINYSELDLDPITDWDSFGVQGASWRAGIHWGGPASTVTVTYSYGYADEAVPGFLRSLSLRVAARTLGNPGAVDSEQLGIYSVKYRSSGADGSHITGAEIKHLRHALGNPAGGTIDAKAR